MEILNTDSQVFTWIILPVLIFLSRIADQSIGTLRLIFLSRGFKIIAPVLGFFEVIIWLLAVTQIIRHAFYSVEDVRSVKEGVFRPKKRKHFFTGHQGTKKIK